MNFRSQESTGPPQGPPEGRGNLRIQHLRRTLQAERSGKGVGWGGLPPSTTKVILHLKKLLWKRMAIWTRVDVDVDAELALALFQLAEVVEVSSFFIPMMIEEGKGGWPKQKLHLLPLLLLLLLLPPLGSISSPNSTSSSLPPPSTPPP